MVRGIVRCTGLGVDVVAGCLPAIVCLFWCWHILGEMLLNVTMRKELGDKSVLEL